jgi:hypothetical protein
MLRVFQKNSMTKTQLVLIEDFFIGKKGEDEAFFPLNQDGAKKLNIAKSGIGGLSSANNSVQIKRVNGLYGGVDLAVSKDVFKGIDKD